LSLTNEDKIKHIAEDIIKQLQSKYVERRKKSKYQEISVGKSVYAVTCIQRLPFLVLS
jgi:hypothetical protein